MVHLLWKHSRYYQRHLTIEQLEDRIVLDAAASPTPQQNPDDNPEPQDRDARGEQPSADSPTAGSAGAPTESDTKVLGDPLDVVLISNCLDDIEAIAQAAPDDARVLVYDSEEDNLVTISLMLEDLTGSAGSAIGNLAVMGHGDAGLVTLGSDTIDLANVYQFSTVLASLGEHLTEDAQIHLYGCSIAEDLLGKALVDSIAVYTEADVFASDDATGGDFGDWDLEYASSSDTPINLLFDLDTLTSVQQPLDEPGGEGGTGTLEAGTQMIGVWWIRNVGDTLYMCASNDGTPGMVLFALDETNGWTELQYFGASLEDPTVLACNDETMFIAADIGPGPQFFQVKDSDVTLIMDQYGGDFYADTGFFWPGLTSDPSDIQYPCVQTEDGAFFAVGYNMSYIVGLYEIHDCKAYQVVFPAPELLWRVLSVLGESWGMEQHFGDMMASVGDYTFFVCDATNPSDPGGEVLPALWVTDGISDPGTYDHTHVVSGFEFNPDGRDLWPRELTVVGDTLFFVHDDGYRGNELWVCEWNYSTDMFEASVIDINPGDNGSNPMFLTEIDGRLFFSASDGEPETGGYGQELWFAEAVPAGPGYEWVVQRVTDINTSTVTGESGSFPSSITHVTTEAGIDRVYFCATNYYVDESNNNFELHYIEYNDATGSYDTHFAAEINPLDPFGESPPDPLGIAGGNPMYLTATDDMLFFSADDGSAMGRVLWYHDPTSGTTQYYPNTVTDTYLSNPQHLTAGSLYFDTGTGLGRFLWSWQATPGVPPGPPGAPGGPGFIPPTADTPVEPAWNPDYEPLVIVLESSGLFGTAGPAPLLEGLVSSPIDLGDFEPESSTMLYQLGLEGLPLPPMADLFAPWFTGNALTAYCPLEGYADGVMEGKAISFNLDQMSLLDLFDVRLTPADAELEPEKLSEERLADYAEYALWQAVSRCVYKCTEFPGLPLLTPRTTLEELTTFQDGK